MESKLIDFNFDEIGKFKKNINEDSENSNCSVNESLELSDYISQISLKDIFDQDFVFTDVENQVKIESSSPQKRLSRISSTPLNKHQISPKKSIV